MYVFIITEVGGTKPKKNFLIENRKYVTKLAKINQMSKENENPLNNVQVIIFVFYTNN